MLSKKILILMIFLVSLLTISAVSATDNATIDIVGIEDTGDVLNIENKSLDDNLDSYDCDEVMSSDSSGTFSDLMYEIINSDFELNLTKNYVFNSNTDSSFTSGITILKKININGNGFEINGNNQSSVFRILSDDVVINDITFNYCNCPVYWIGDNGILSNCSFQNCNGGIRWDGNKGILEYCSFKSCYKPSSYYGSNGGAVCWFGNKGNMNYCTFENCYIYSKSDYDVTCRGGAVYWDGDSGILSNCDFKNCYVYTVALSQTYLKLYSYGGALYCEGYYCYLENSNFTNCYAKSSSSSFAAVYSKGGAVYWQSWIGYIFKCNFKNNKAISSASERSTEVCAMGGAICIDRSDVVILESYFNRNIAQNGSAIYWYGADGMIKDSILLTKDSNLIIYSKYSLNAQYNWWGSSSKPLVSNLVNVNNRLNLVIRADKTSLDVDETVLIKIDFNNIVGSSNKYLNSHLADIGAIIKKSDGSSSRIAVHNGVAEFEYVANKIPEGHVCIQIEDTDIQYNISFNVFKRFTKIIAQDVNAVYDGGEYVIATLKDNHDDYIVGVNVSVSLDGEVSNVVSDENGQVKLNVDGLAAKTYVAIISYDGNEKYNPTNATVAITVNKLTTSILIYYDETNEELVASLINTETGKGIKGATVVFNLNGAKTAVKTDKQGQARFSIGNIGPNNFNAGISYGGNSKYLKSTGSIKIVEGKIPTVISNVYDKEAGEVVATLTNFETGKPISSATVVFNVNGVKTPYKTNKQGQVKISVADFEPGVWSVGSSYGGNFKYGGSTTGINIVKT